MNGKYDPTANRVYLVEGWPMLLRKRPLATVVLLTLLTACGGAASPTTQPATIPAPTTAAAAAPTEAAPATAAAAAPTEPAPTAAVATPTTGAPGRVSSAGRIAFTSDRDGNQDIYLLTVDGAGETRLTSDPSNELSPAWSPDGREIVFSSDRDGDFEIYVMQADGSQPQRLTTSAGDDTAPAWSPDGLQIAFVSDRDGNPDIYVMNADGSNPRNVTQHPARDGDPAWSPDSTQLVFSSYRDASADTPAANDLYLVQADGSLLVTRLTNDLARNGAPAWAADGALIAFEYFDGAGMVDGDIAGGDIYVMNRDGSSQRRLTTDTTGGRSPSWSADGTRIAFASARNNNSTFDIYTMNADGSEPLQLTSAPSSESEPAYAPGSQ
jgi:Tol biopolymer transport system component